MLPIPLIFCRVILLLYRNPRPTGSDLSPPRSRMKRSSPPCYKYCRCFVCGPPLPPFKSVKTSFFPNPLKPFCRSCPSNNWSFSQFHHPLPLQLPRCSSLLFLVSQFSGPTEVCPEQCLFFQSAFPGEVFFCKVAFPVPIFHFS